MPRRLAAALAALLLAASAATAQDAPPAEKPPAPAEPAPAAAPRWFADFDAATAAAREAKKDLFVLFTGSDWCRYCITLHDEVLGTDAFGAAAPLRFVLVSLDFPESPEARVRVPNPSRNTELAEKYRVRGFPTVLLMTADGDPYAELGYRPGGAAKWIEAFDKARERGRAMLLDALAVRNVFAVAKGDARGDAAAAAVALLEKAGEGDAWAEQLLPAARAALETDPANAKGLRLRAVKALLDRGAADEAVLAAALELDPKNEHGVREVAVAARVAAVRDEETLRAAVRAIEELDAADAIRDRDRKCLFYANLAFWYRQNLGDPAKAKAWAEKLKAVADPGDERFRPILEAVLGKPDEKAPEKAPEPAK